MLVVGEDALSGAVALKLATLAYPGESVAHQVSNGRSNVQTRIRKYNDAARHMRVVVLVDLDSDACPSDLVARWIPNRAGGMHLRVAVREVESWLLADREGFANYFAVSTDRLSREPDEDRNPKQTLVRLASSSRNRVIREDVGIGRGETRSVGPAYNAQCVTFVERLWNPIRGAQFSPSLGRALDRLGLRA